MTKTITDKQVSQIMQLKAKGISIYDIIAETGISRGKVEYYYYERNARKQAKKTATKTQIKPQTIFETCIIDGWRVPFDQDRQRKECTTRQATPEELAKYSNVQGYKRPALCPYEDYWKRKRAM